MEVKEFIIMVA